jgi:hypothetical protein
MSIVKVKKVRPTQKKRKPCGCRKKKLRIKQKIKPAIKKVFL